MRAAVVAAAALCACAGAGAQKPSEPDRSVLGLSKATAIEVCLKKGEREYLARLRCADGSKPVIGERANVGVRDPVEAPPGGYDALSFRKSLDPNRRLDPGERDPHIVDRYSIKCGERNFAVYLDMYHCAAAAQREAPPGLLLAPE